MWKRLVLLLSLSLALILTGARARVRGAFLEIEPNRVLNQIDEKVYSHFLEHIYHSVNGGLWGDLVWDRSFEEWPKPEKDQPAGSKSEVVAKHWHFYGKGSPFRAGDHPFYSDSAQGIVSTEDAAGVAQRHFCLRKGETYYGSLWALGEAPDGMVVRLVEEGAPDAIANMPSTLQVRPVSLGCLARALGKLPARKADTGHSQQDSHHRSPVAPPAFPDTHAFVFPGFLPGLGTQCPGLPWALTQVGWQSGRQAAPGMACH